MEHLWYRGDKSSFSLRVDPQSLGLVDEKSGQLTEFAREKLREAFRIFDTDQDGVWSVAEFNAFLKATGSEQRVAHEEHLDHLLKDLGVNIGSTGCLSEADVLELYEAQGIAEVLADLNAVGIRT